MGSCSLYQYNPPPKNDIDCRAVLRCLIHVQYVLSCMTILIINDRIGGVMVSVLASSAVYRGFEPRSGQTKDYKIGMCCFSAKHAALRRTSKDWLARNQDNVSEWVDISIRPLSFQCASTIKIQLNVLV